MNFSFNTWSSQFQGYVSQFYDEVNNVIDVIKSLDLDDLDDSELEESQKLSSINLSEKISDRKFQFPFPVVYQSFAHNPQDFDALKKQVEDYNQIHPKKLKIAFGNECIEDKGYSVWIGYSAAEFNTLCFMSGCEFLRDYFFSFKGNVFQYPDYVSRFYGCFVEKISLIHLRNQYETMPKILAASTKIDLLIFDNFSRSTTEIKQILSTLLEKNKGILVGGIYENPIYKHLLQEQMQNFSSMNVKTLFLQHCCYDTLQAELDEFFHTKEASPFLENFLKNGCGILDEKMNDYDMVKSAVDAGIRPVGLKRSRALDSDDSTFENSTKNCLLEFNVGAVEIINKYKEVGKFVALIDLGHLSYYDDIAGLSELCHVPSMSIESDDSISISSFQSDMRDLNIAEET